MVRKVDLSTELQILAFHEQRRLAGVVSPDPVLAAAATAAVRGVR